MLSTILGTKGKMSAAFVGDTRVSLTWVKAGPCVVSQIKTIDKDGYWAVQVGFATKKVKNLSKPLQGHFKNLIKDNYGPRFLREIRLKDKPDIKVGDIISVSDIFNKGDEVSVTGTSKGKGFAGVVKRWRFAGGPRTHGQSDRERAPGAIGSGTTPGRILKGKHMAGRMGGETKTVKSLIVVDIDKEGGRLAISGAIPGATNGLLIIRKTASGKLEELIEETPEVQVQVEEGEEEKDKGTDNKNKTEKVEVIKK